MQKNTASRILSIQYDVTSKNLCRLFTLLVIGMCLISFQKNAYAETVYENQASMTERELLSFIELLPQFRAWARANSENAHPIVNNGNPDFIYSEAAVTWIQEKNWNPRRFFAIMGKSAAGLYILSEGKSVNDPLLEGMPRLSQEELNLIQIHLSALLQAGNNVGSM